MILQKTQPKTKVLRISYTNKATIPSGRQYENQSPCYTITREIEMPEDFIEESVQDYARQIVEDIKEQIDGRITKDFDSMLNFRNRERPDSGMYRVIDGQAIPRVTSIITPDRPPIPFIEDHAELGTAMDEVGKIYTDTGIVAYMDFEDKGNVKLTWDELFQTFNDWIEANKESINMLHHSIPVLHDDLTYCGELDCICEYKGDKKNPAGFYILDFKKTKILSKEIKEKYFMQMSAYAEAQKVCDVKGMIIASPFNEPVIDTNIEKYFKKFIKKREAFKQRFGI